MAALPFNHVFVAGEDLALRSNLATLWAAYNERATAATGSGLGSGGIPVPTVGGDALAGWRQLQASTLALSAKYVKSQADDGTPLTNPADYTAVVPYSGSGPADTLVPVYQSGPAVYVYYNTPPFSGPAANELTWPPPGGFTRKFPREIHRLDYPGTYGQLARFVVRTSGKWYQARTGPYFNKTLSGTAETGTTTPPTPATQYVHAGLTKRYDGSAWIDHTDPYAYPDVVTDKGLAQPGDILGSLIANELRDAIDRLRWTPSAVTWVSTTDSRARGEWGLQYRNGPPTYAPYGTCSTAGADFDALVATAKGKMLAHWGTTYSESGVFGTSCGTNITGSVANTLESVGTPPGSMWSRLQSSAPGTKAFTQEGTPRVGFGTLAAVKTVEVVAVATKPASSFYYLGAPAPVEFDPTGFGWTESQPFVAQTFTAVAAGTATATGARLGNKDTLPVESHDVFTTDGTPVGGRGFALTAVGVVKWNVSGGFANVL